VKTFVYINICIHKYTYTCVYIYIARTCLYRIYICINDICIYMYMHMYICIFVHTYKVYSYKCTNVAIQLPNLPQGAHEQTAAMAMPAIPASDGHVLSSGIGHPSSSLHPY